VKEILTDTRVRVALSFENLTEIFKPHLDWNAARLKCFAILIVSVIRIRTVNMVFLAAVSSNTTQQQSTYRRFQRFFAEFLMPLPDIGTLVLSLLTKPQSGWVLSMDRTNWQLGKKHINILTVGVVLGGMAFPIVWMRLPNKTKDGNSNTKHRIKVLKKVLDLVSPQEIECLTMDREFVGKRWLAWLEAQDIGYVVRVKRNTIVGAVKAYELATRRGRGKKDCFGKRYEIYGQQLHFAWKAIKKGRDSHLLVISNRFQGQQALDLYWQRWGIELFFSHLKKRGFNFEDTHLTAAAKVDRLVAVLAVAFTLCHRWGAILDEKKSTKKKKHGHRAKSLFRRGLESLLGILSAPFEKTKDATEFIISVLLIPLASKNVV